LKSLGIDREIVDGNCNETEINWDIINAQLKTLGSKSKKYLSEIVNME
jgi:hypothetical protein